MMRLQFHLWECDFAESELHKIVHNLMNTTNITAVSMEIGMSALLTSCKNHQAFA